MRQIWLFTLMLLVVSCLLAPSSAWTAPPQIPVNATWTNVLVRGDVIDGITVGNMEGLTGDNNGFLYVADRGLLDGGADPNNLDTCHVWRIEPDTGDVDLVGQITADPCRPSGLAFDANGDLFITTSVEGGIIYQLTPNAAAPTGASATGAVYATGVPGANGVAFDKHGNLLVTDGTRAFGSVWRIGPGGGDCDPEVLDNCVELFRVPPRRNGTNLGGNVLPAVQPDGVGAVRYTVPRHNTGAASSTDRQDIVANGVAVAPDGKTILVADTSRGACWAVETKSNGDLDSATGCDPTLSANTLCMDSLDVAHPLLEGADGIAVLTNGTVLASANERNAIVAITSAKEVADFFQNAVDPVTLLRNGNDTDDRPLDAPSSPFVSGRRFCTTNADFPRRNNNPSIFNNQKVVCLDQDIQTSGLPLPVK